jgi:hypothetical protein
MPIEKRSKAKNVHCIFKESERRKELEAVADSGRQIKWQIPDGREKLGNITQSYIRVSQHGLMAQK